MDRRITIKGKSIAENSFGECIETWTDLATVWAEVREIRGGERYAAMQTQASVDRIFRIRYRAGITPENIIYYDGKDYDIGGILEIGRREGLEIYASARAE